jgi:hypothetical protein
MPRSIFGVVSESFDIIKRNPIIVLPVLIAYVAVTLSIGTIVVFTGIYAVLGLHVTTYLHHMPSINSISQHAILLVSVLVLIAFVIIGLVQLLLGGIYVSMGEQFYTGRKVSLDAAFKKAESRYLAMLGAGVIMLAVVLLIALVLGSILYIGGRALLASFSWPLLFTVIILAILPLIAAVIIAILFFQTTTVIIVENKGPVPAIKKAMEIGGKNFLAIFALYLIIAVLYAVLGLFALIPIVGIIIQFIGGTILGIISLLVQPGFYFNYVSTNSKRRKLKQ